MFYWMRLFSATAKYVKLIVQTIADLEYFLVMVSIIILAFSTFFLIINYNALIYNLDYIPDYGLSSFIDSAVSSYFIAGGEFSDENYSAGPNVFSVWIMFLLATFMNCVVFMNMLVAIMG